jgi:hypothetical protein
LGIGVTGCLRLSQSIISFQELENMAKPSEREDFKEVFQDIVASFSIFDPSKLPQKDSPDLWKSS